MRMLIALISAIALLCSGCPEKSQEAAEQESDEVEETEEVKTIELGPEGQKIKMIRKKDAVLNEVDSIMKKAQEKRDQKLGGN